MYSAMEPAFRCFSLQAIAIFVTVEWDLVSCIYLFVFVYINV